MPIDRDQSVRPPWHGTCRLAPGPLAAAGETWRTSSRSTAGSRYRRSLRSMRILLKVLYWLAVVAISLALVAALILWFESHDASEVEGSGLPAPVST